MSDEEEYDSSEDEDYIPSDGEAVSEEENSGEEENLDLLKEDGETIQTGKRNTKSPKKPSRTRKRVGGIKLENEDTSASCTDQDDGTIALQEQIRLEQERKQAELEKKRSDDLWSSFMSDVGHKKSTPKPVAFPGLGSISGSLKSNVCTSSSASSPTTSTNTDRAAVPKSTITVTKVYDFAGEAVKVTKEIDVNSKEGKAELKKLQKGDQDSEKATKSSCVKRSSGGLDGILEKINKKPKLGTLEKSKIDWDEFKLKEGIEEELKIHNRGKQSYIERMNFLQRTDQKQYEIERDMRLSSSSSKR